MRGKCSPLLLLFETRGAEPAFSFSASLIILLRGHLHGPEYSCQWLMLLLDGTVEVFLVAALCCLMRVGGGAVASHGGRRGGSDVTGPPPPTDMTKRSPLWWRVKGRLSLPPLGAPPTRMSALWKRLSPVTCLSLVWGHEEGTTMVTRLKKNFPYVAWCSSWEPCLNSTFSKSS
ncbi:uncharacterized protein LOC115318618 [Ixodes scapularis]|uniref:uncharacterized protein LOC115318618 n=1 Tax=Ixodes scapularis TaxID=6945 RepID=UPI001A9D04C7|nr:uncharacterized protein LOC115318618 [Ixodes scapularis]